MGSPETARPVNCQNRTTYNQYWEQEELLFILVIASLVINGFILGIVNHFYVV